MQERTKIIEKGLADAKESAEKLSQAQTEQQVILQEARQKSQQILTAMEKDVVKERGQLLAQAQAEVQKLLEDNQKQLTTEKQKMLLQVKKEVVDLVVLATSKVLEKTVNDKLDAEIIKKSLEDAESELKI